MNSKKISEMNPPVPDTNFEYYKSLVLDNATDCAWVYSFGKKRFLYISPSVYYLQGFTVEEAMKLSLEKTFTPKSIQIINNTALKRFPRFLNGERSNDVVYGIEEHEQYCKDGSIINVEISTRLMLDEDNKNIAVIGISRDITYRKQYEKNLINQLRAKTQLLQNQTETIKATPSNIRIYFFQKFCVYGKFETKPLHWHTLKNEELFAFLLLHKNPSVYRDEIIEALWPDVSLEKATAYLHNTLYSMKKDLKSIGIEVTTKIKNNHYTYQIPQYYSDIKQFTDIIENTILPYDSIDDIAAHNFEQIILLYHGDFLNQNGYIWSMSKNTHYHKQFKSAALSLSKYYFLNRNYTSTKKVLLKILEIDYYDETIHELLLIVYLQNHEHSCFVNHFDAINISLYSECHIKPKASIQNIYQKFYMDAKRISDGKTAHFD
jgi:PAS domain S-box-containing protein